MAIKSSTAGLRDWLVQRITSVIIGLYAILLMVYWVDNSPLSFTRWQHLFQNLAVKIGTVIVLLAILWHAWIGLWTVLTDYIKNNTLRLILQTAVMILLVAYVIWGIMILWV